MSEQCWWLCVYNLLDMTDTRYPLLLHHPLHHFRCKACATKQGHMNWHYDGSSRGKPTAGVLAFGSFLPRFSLAVEALDLSALLYRHNMLTLVRIIIRHLSKAFKFPEKYTAFKLKKKKSEKYLVTCMSTWKKNRSLGSGDTVSCFIELLVSSRICWK